jgi:glutamate carboxypeptidase
MTWLDSQLPSFEDALAGLVNINSFTGNREGGNQVGKLLLEAFAIEGVTSEVVPSSRFADHLVFRTQGRAGTAPIALVGHHDTVFPPGSFEGYRSDGALRRGPGVLDMKSGLLVIAWALKALAREFGFAGLPPLVVVSVGDEEVGSPEGAPLLRKAIAGAQACLVFESGRANDAIVTSRKGSGTVTAQAHGKAAHAGNGHAEGINAIWALSRFLDAAQQLTSYEKGATVNVGLVSGGTARNTVPAEATAQLDLRFTSQADAEDLRIALRGAAVAAGAAVKGARVEIIEGLFRAPMERTLASAALARAYGACAKFEGLGDGESPRVGGGSDACTAHAMGIPSIDALGPRGKGFHTHEECIELDTVLPRIKALARFLASR